MGGPKARASVTCRMISFRRTLGPITQTAGPTRLHRWDRSLHSWAISPGTGFNTIFRPDSTATPTQLADPVPTEETSR